jgi:hypothetical protein
VAPSFGETAPTTAQYENCGYSTCPRCFSRAPMRSRCGCSFSGRPQTNLLHQSEVWCAGKKRGRNSATGRPWPISPSRTWADRGRLDRDLDQAILVPGLWPYHQRAAGLAPSPTLVCRAGHHRGALSALCFARDRPSDRCALWQISGIHGVAKPPPLARPAVALADPVGLVGDKAGNQQTGRRQAARSSLPGPIFGRRRTTGAFGHGRGPRYSADRTPYAARLGPRQEKSLAHRTLPVRGRIPPFPQSSSPCLTHTEGLWPALSLIHILRDIIQIKLRRNP